MSLEITLLFIFSALFIRDFFSESKYRPLKAIVPSTQVGILLLFSLLITAISEQKLCSPRWIDRLMHAGVGGVCLLGVLIAVYFTEHELIGFTKELFKKKKIN